MNLHLPNENPFNEPSEGGSESKQEKIQRILNEKKRRELAERYGAAFGEADPSLPVDVEAEWLDYVEEFERQFEDAARITVREYLGYPIVVSLATIAPQHLEAELNQLLEFMYLHGVAVHFLSDVEDHEAYRFIVEELFEEEIDDIRIPGMMTNFIYEEFHPNDEYDAKIWAQDFLFSLFGHHREGIEIALCRDELYTAGGLAISHADMMCQIDAFFARHPSIIDTQIDPIACTLDGDYANVDVATTWTSVRTDPEEQFQYCGRSSFRLKRSDYGGWDVVKAKVAGFDSPV
ncbi:MAG: hypothetical protein KDE58_28245 [Caldilineaceae bacterium]|nr:hypothetical protein [Caldilineaceae bacterium]